MSPPVPGKPCKDTTQHVVEIKKGAGVRLCSSIRLLQNNQCKCVVLGQQISKDLQSIRVHVLT